MIIRKLKNNAYLVEDVGDGDYAFGTFDSLVSYLRQFFSEPIPIFNTTDRSNLIQQAASPDATADTAALANQ